MLQLEGNRALSDFRQERLLSTLREGVPVIRDIQVQYIHFLSLSGYLSEEDMRKASLLLHYGDPMPVVSTPNRLLIAPRPGTISPWSSKASDIFHNCGLTTVKRVERGRLYHFICPDKVMLTDAQILTMLPLLHDKMTEACTKDPNSLFYEAKPRPLITIPVKVRGMAALKEANRTMGLALSDKEVEYLHSIYKDLDRDPTDVELLMFGQVNSEHCRHKIFNAQWSIDGKTESLSLFDMIRHTHKVSPKGTLLAYSDNSAIMEGFPCLWFHPDQDKQDQYSDHARDGHFIMKVETHNHPTAISPHPGASTGVGGEIRDEGATGTGSKPKAGLCAFYVSNLNLPGTQRPWEKQYADFPTRLATPFSIMMEGPIGGAGFGNEFGRPNILGQFRTFETVCFNRYYGYHKPIMAAGGMGAIDSRCLKKKDIHAGDFIIQIGGPAMLIGLGGGAASSMNSGSNAEELDFNSVQRDNPEMERRCQEVIDRCYFLGEENPILSIHDVGAGGLSNACPELISECGALFNLRAIQNDDPGMSPAEIWCNEAQERYMLAVKKEKISEFEALCKRERCPFRIIGTATEDGRLVVDDPQMKNRPIDLPLSALLGKPPKMIRHDQTVLRNPELLDVSDLALEEAVGRVLSFPAVSDKTFLITIADRTVTGMVMRDQMVGPYQIPVSDNAVLASDFQGYKGSAMSMGDRAPSAVINAPASGRMAVGEAITNIVSADIPSIESLKLSANWMAPAGEAGEDAALFQTVKTVGMELCPTLGISIPVGKDSLSMKTVWQDKHGKTQKMTAPISLVVTAFAPVNDVRKSVTPDLKQSDEETVLLLLDLSGWKNRIGFSTLAQVFNRTNGACADLDDAEQFKKAMDALLLVKRAGWIWAMHDRSDGGLFVTLFEMAVAGGCGLKIDLSGLPGSTLEALFNEELGLVFQVRQKDLAQILSVFKQNGVEHLVKPVARPVLEKVISISDARAKEVFKKSLSSLRRIWSETTYLFQSMRDNPVCAKEEYDRILDETDPGLPYRPVFDPSAPFVAKGKAPSIAILREQGVNGQVEMAAAFHAAGFNAFDVTMTDLIEGRKDINSFQALVACGGFSYGDVLGAGAGWARSILFNSRLQDMFFRFFQNPGTLTLGVCNGCQMVAQLKEMIPGASHWPLFLRNKSEQFEARLTAVRVNQSGSLLFKGMAGSVMPIACAHGEGRAVFSGEVRPDRLIQQGWVPLQYVDNHGSPTERYPFNPNGSVVGLTAVTSEDGRATIMMPHPERLFRSVQFSWLPDKKAEQGAWLKIFRNARIAF
ncbi:MAG: phosphoribosylformylglycinamidine synthase [Elusimicrobia bacterium RIFOXYB2_FULL_49_7]|nr:MAG: phosphoribosylformylglycinamidine synthase [Elusimicrobia bacterium RIFOXYB2_FULL_49_7]